MEAQTNGEKFLSDTTIPIGWKQDMKYNEDVYSRVKMFQLFNFLGLHLPLLDVGGVVGGGVNTTQLSSPNFSRASEKTSCIHFKRLINYAAKWG